MERGNEGKRKKERATEKGRERDKEKEGRTRGRNEERESESKHLLARRMEHQARYSKGPAAVRRMLNSAKDSVFVPDPSAALTNAPANDDFERDSRMHG